MLPGKGRHLLDLGGGDVFRIDAAHCHPLMMDFEHDLRRAFAAHVKKTLQHDHHKVHGGVVVIEQKHLVEARE